MFVRLISFINIDNSDDSPVSSNKSVPKVDSPLNREIPSPIQARTSENSRQYKNMTDFTGPKITPKKVRQTSTMSTVFILNSSA